MKITKLILITLILMGLMFVPSLVAAQNVAGNLCSGANLDSISVTPLPNGECPGPVNSPTVEGTAIKIVNILSWIVGIISVIMLIYGGFRYITSGGNDASVKAAKNTILYAIVGLVVVALAQVIVRFVIGQFG